MNLWRACKSHLNFYRTHLLFFTFTPLIFSGIFYASNGEYHISYIDSLFNCVSAMAVCGLATIDLSLLTPWQQVILFIQMCIGSPIVVSWCMVYLRRHYFATKFRYIINNTKASKLPPNVLAAQTLPWYRRPFQRPKHPQDVNDEESDDNSEHKGSVKKLRTDMIRRMDDAPKLVDPSGWISEGRAVPLARTGTVQSGQEGNRHLSFAAPSPERPPSLTPQRTVSRRLSDPGTVSRPTSLRNGNTGAPMQRYETIGLGGSQQQRTPRTFISDLRPEPVEMNRTQTVEFARQRRPTRDNTGRLSDFHEDASEDIRVHRTPLHPHASFQTYPTAHSFRPQGTKHSGFGGFPMPLEIIGKVINKFFPKLERRLTRTVTVPRSTTIASTQHNTTTPGTKLAPYITFETVVGRNSTFPYLTANQLEELGGVEYRALNALLWIIAAYHIGIHLFGLVIIAPYMSQSKWNSDLNPPSLHRPVDSTWYAVFQVASSYTNTGMSLVDTSMVPFQKAYLMIVVMIFLILAGNTSFPIFLRFTIWILSKLVPSDSRANETLHFLLDHPRRCYIYLFPSYQTWFLLTVVLFLTATDWFFFMVLDIGTPAIEAVPLNTRFVIGLLQAIAVRAAGFGTISLSALAPAVKVLYVVMMYVSVYPIAMSVRSTNVYEEQSLGIFNGDKDSDDESEFQPTGTRVTVWSRYLTMHARKQLSFDMWWIGLALFLVCIIERNKLEDPDNYSWFTIFNIVFELVSAYGTVGLSLGLPTANSSFCSEFSTLSKLIVALVMLRGRHRGLPVAIDRAVMFPMEFKKGDLEDEEEDDDLGSRSHIATNNGLVDEKSVNGGESFDLRQRSTTHPLQEMEEDSSVNIPRTGSPNEMV